jgi:hypothetical protein
MRSPFFGSPVLYYREIFSLLTPDGAQQPDWKHTLAIGTHGDGEWMPIRVAEKAQRGMAQKE